MEVQEVLHFLDQVVYTKTGKHLNDLQRTIIEGTLNRQKYTEIAEAYGCSAGHAKDVGYELLKMLSEALDEPVDKNNLKSVVERQHNLNISLGNKSSINTNNIIGCINFDSDYPNNNSHRASSQDFNKLDNKELGKIQKLRKLRLSDEQISEILELPLEVIQQVMIEEDF